MLKLHRQNARIAAHGYSALFRGEASPGALAAGVRLHTCVEYLIVWVKSHEKR